LLALIDAGGAVVAKSELMDLVWPGTAVEENNLTVESRASRRALGEDRRLVLTIAGRGYRFAGELDAGRGFRAEMSAVPQRVPSAKVVLAVIDEYLVEFMGDLIRAATRTRAELDLGSMRERTEIARLLSVLRRACRSRNTNANPNSPGNLT
jgi:hypothetical protein